MIKIENDGKGTRMSYIARVKREGRGPGFDASRAWFAAEAVGYGASEEEARMNLGSVLYDMAAFASSSASENARDFPCEAA